MTGTERTGFTDAALVRLLAAWRGQPHGGTATDFAGPLSGWLRWTDAQPLFAALQEPLNVAPCAADEDASPEAAQADCASVQRLLTRSLTDDAPWREPPRPQRRSASAGWTPSAAAVTEAPALDFPLYRRHYLAQQQHMQEHIAPLRARLRRVLELRSPACARLAALDAVMERVLGEPERRLLAGLPALLEQRFAQWRAEAAPGNGWATRFQQELEAALQAELALRWQPIDGLLAALHGRLSGPSNPA